MFNCQLGNTVDIFECLRGRLEPESLEMYWLMTLLKKLIQGLFILEKYSNQSNDFGIHGAKFFILYIIH